MADKVLSVSEFLDFRQQEVVNDVTSELQSAYEEAYYAKEKTKENSIGTIARTASQIGIDFFKGTEGLADLVNIGLAKTADLVGADSVSQHFQDAAAMDQIGTLERVVAEAYDPYTFSGFKSGELFNQIAGGIGQYGYYTFGGKLLELAGASGTLNIGSKIANSGVGAVLSQNASLYNAVQQFSVNTPLLLSQMGQNTAAKLAEGYGLDESITYGFGSAALSATIEGAAGGLEGKGVGFFDDAFSASFNDTVAGKIASGVTSGITSSLSESGEEVAEYYLEKFLAKATLDEKIAIDGDEVLQAAIVGGLTALTLKANEIPGGIASVKNTAAVNAEIRDMVDFYNNAADVEALVFEKTGIELTTAQRRLYYDNLDTKFKETGKYDSGKQVDSDGNVVVKGTTLTNEDLQAVAKYEEIVEGVLKGEITETAIKNPSDYVIKDYIRKMNNIKERNPEDYWSVDKISEEDLAKGTIINVDGGYGFVSESGDIKGVFKYDNNEKGVGKKIVDESIKAGGIKLDNFDVHMDGQPNLTSIYEKSGFRVVSRTEFNEDYAPEGWNKEKHGTPDVVAMIYDKNNTLDIKEKTFTGETGYDDMIAYRDSFVDQLPTKVADEVDTSTKNKIYKRKDTTALKLKRETANSQEGLEYMDKAVGDNRFSVAANELKVSSEKANAALERGVVNEKLENITESINGIFEDIPDLAEYSEYARHKQNIYRDKNSKGLFETTSEQSQKIVNELYKPEYDDIDSRIKEVYDTMLKLQYEAGVFTKAEYNEILNQNPNFYPLYAVDDTGIFRNLIAKKSVKTSDLNTATKGSQEVEFQDVATAMESYLRSAYKRIASQKMGKVLGDSLGAENATEKMSTTEKAMTELTDGVYISDGGNYYYTYFENGTMMRVKIPKYAYDAFIPFKIKDTEAGKNLNIVITGLEKLGRGLSRIQTELNPDFVRKNPIRDWWDAQFNTVHNVVAYNKRLGKSVYELSKGEGYVSEYENFGTRDFMSTAGQEGFGKAKNKVTKVVRSVNSFLEHINRYNEYALSREAGKSPAEAMTDSLEVTLNFAKGGRTTKALNSEVGLKFLNASIVGFDKIASNISNGGNVPKGVAALVVKAMASGISLQLLESMLYGDDDEYLNLTDRAKDNNFLIKIDGKFFKIPNGRVMSMFTGVSRRAAEVMQGNRDIEDFFEGYADLFENVAPLMPWESTIFAPLFQAANNKSWYGSDIVPTRLENLPDAEQWDENTTSVAKFLGNISGLSPKKIDYVLQQYSGYGGKLISPLLTPAYETKNSLFGDMYYDPTIENRITGDFYDLLDDVTQEAAYNKLYSIEDDMASIKSSYMNSEVSALSNMYSDLRKIQMGNDKNKAELVIEKKKEIMEQQAKITDKVENATSPEDFPKQYIEITYESDKNEKGNAIPGTAIGKKAYYLVNETDLSDDEVNELLDGLSSSANPKTVEELSRLEKSETVYKYYFGLSNKEKFNTVISTGIEQEQYVDYKQNMPDNPTKKDKIELISELDGLDSTQKLILYGMEGYSLSDYQKSKIVNYIKDYDVDERDAIIDTIKSFD